MNTVVTKAVFYWDQPFQPKPVLVRLVEVLKRTFFQEILVQTQLTFDLVWSFPDYLNFCHKGCQHWRKRNGCCGSIFSKWPITMLWSV